MQYSITTGANTMPASIIPVTGLVLGPIGSFSQTDFPLVTPRPINATDALIPNFGDTLILNANNTYSSINQWITNASGVLKSSTPVCFAAINIKTNTTYPTNGTQYASIVGSGNYPAGSEADGFTRGTINVALNNGTPAGAGSPVFIRTVANGSIPAGVVGGIEAVVDGGTPVAAALAGNTGNTTLGTLSLGLAPLSGAYSVIYTDATHFNVFDPTGVYVGTGVNGTAFTSTGVNFTATTGGTAMVRGDGFTVTTSLKTIAIPNIVFKTGIVSTDPGTGLNTVQVTILERKVC
jgi:hypothetical protein